MIVLLLLQKKEVVLLVGNWDDGKKNINHPQKIKSNTFKIKYYLYTPFALLRFYAFTAAAKFVLFLFYIDTHDFIHCTSAAQATYFSRAVNM